MRLLHLSLELYKFIFWDGRITDLFLAFIEIGKGGDYFDLPG